MNISKVPVQVKLPEEVMARLAEESEATGIPVALLVRRDVLAVDAQRRGSSVSESISNTTRNTSDTASEVA